MKNNSACLLLICSCAAQVLFAQPEVAVFTDHAEFEEIKISPKGAYLAMTQKAMDEEYLLIVKSDNLEGVSRISFGSDTDIASFDWVNEERLLISPGRAFNGQLDYKQPTGEIFGINADGTNFEILFGYKSGKGYFGKVRRKQASEAAGRIVDSLPDDPDHVIVQSIGYGVEGEFNQAWVMDVNDGSLDSLAKSPIRNGLFVTDANHEIRFVSGANTENIGELYVREDSKWTLLATEKDRERWLQPVAPRGADGAFLVLDLGPEQTTGLSVWNPQTGEKKDVFHHPLVDINARYTDNDKNMWAVKYHQHMPQYFYPDETHPFVAIHKSLREQFLGYDVQIIDETDDLSKLIVYVSGPRFPGTFLLMDAVSQKLLMHLPQYPKVPVDSLGRMDPVEINTRDGENIWGYITVPPGSAEENLPLVVLPHGGPHGVFDTWRYDFETQLLASHGYAVLQVNYRGSGGRGEKFQEAGYGEWGGKMQDDITDATRWAIADGVADPERICIYGASYGAYAALTGVSKEPDLYKCAVGMSGVYDLNLMFKSGDISGADRGVSYLKEVLGEDKDLLKSRSPVENADKIKANIMLIHGKQDARAPYEHAKRMRKALDKQDKEVVWLTEGGEMHGIMSEENRAKVYQAMLQFLDDNIGH